MVDSVAKSGWHIAGMIASLTESEPRGESEKLQNHAWLTGTTPRGGQGVWLSRRVEAQRRRMSLM